MMRVSLRIGPRHEVHHKDQILCVNTRGLAQPFIALWNKLVIGSTLKCLNGMTDVTIRINDLIGYCDSEKSLLFSRLSDNRRGPLISIPDMDGFILKRGDGQPPPLRENEGIRGHAEVGGLDRAQILLIGLGIGGVLV
jgi:hypothetical protein